jgi:cyclohexanecarboxylate-CoA ligase
LGTALPRLADRYTDDEVEAFYAAGYWSTETLADLLDNWAEARCDAPFVSDRTTTLTFGELRDRAYRVAAGLARTGIDPGDRVVVQLPNWTDFVVVVAALARRGAIVVPVMPIYRHDEVRYVLQHAEVRAVVTCTEFNGFGYGAMYDSLRADAPGLDAVYLARADEAAGAALPLDSLVVEGPLDSIESELGLGPSADDGHLIVYTSGTTARPKGCVHTWNTTAFAARTLATNLGWDSNDVNFGPSPITHSTGYVTSVVVPLLVGGRSHLLESWDPKVALTRIAEYSCTTAVTATAFLQMLVAAYDPTVHNAECMRMWVAAGSPIPATVVEDARRVLPTMEVLSLYGRSENFVSTMCSTGAEPRRSTTSDGCPPAGVEVKAVDEHGHEVPIGSEGDLAYRGAGHMLGYLGDPEQTAQLFTNDGFSRSGDLGVVDDAGYVRVTGRLKDIIIRGGLNISAREIEDLLLGHPDLRAVAVIGAPDERLGETVCACIVAADGACPSLDALVTYLTEKHQLAKQKLPQSVQILEALPMTATGKVQKHVLRKIVADKEAGDP